MLFFLSLFDCILIAAGRAGVTDREEEEFEVTFGVLLDEVGLFTVSFFLLPLFDVVVVDEALAIEVVFGSLFKLKLESLRADEKPLLELVRFDDLERSLSLLKSFNLSSIECFAGGCCCEFVA